MTDAEIIKALEYCSKQGITSECEKCTVGNGCRSELIISALDIINRQKADIERLSNFVTEERCMEIAKEMIPEFVKQAKSEAIKEFAEKVKAKKNTLFNYIYSERGFDEQIDNLVKEKAGDTE